MPHKISNITGIESKLERIEHHFHDAAKCYPTLAAGKVVTGGVASWALGSFVEIVPVNTISSAFDIHFIVFEAVSATDTYELVLYSGLVGSEVEIARIRTTRESATSGTTDIPCMCYVQPPNTRISAKVASSSGGSDTVTISIFYHTYE
jgi:hypothetical protein